jgi:putative N-acetylmannosamine-6-phosphate epimerase
MADIPAGDVAVVAGGFGRSALFSIHALRAAASFAALTLFNIAALNSARIRRAFLCVGAALAAAGLAFTVCGLRLESLRDIAALSPLMELPVFSEFYEDAGIHILRVGLAALAAALLAVAAYFASRAARPGASVKRAEKSTVRLIVTSAVSATATAACGWFAYMAFAA